MKDIVRCHAGWHYPEHPQALFWEDKWLDVIHVLHEWRRPDGYGYVVRTADEKLFELHYYEDSDSWQIKPYPGRLPSPGID